MSRILLAAAVLCFAQECVGQNPDHLGPRSFFPPEYVGEAYVDFERLIETDLWDELERSMLMKAGFGAFARDFGFRLDDLARMRIAFSFSKSDDATTPYHAGWVTVMEGSRPLPLPEPREGESPFDRRTSSTIGGYPIVREGPDDGGSGWPKLFVAPARGLLVCGDEDLIAPVLRGDRRGGVPAPELMAFTAAKRPLAYLAVKLDYDQRYLMRVAPFPFDWYTARDEPRFLMIKVTVDEATQQTDMSLRIRFTSGEAGPQLMREKTLDSFTRLDTDPTLRQVPFVKKIVDLLTIEQDDTDFVVTADLGVGGERFGVLSLGQLVPMFLLASQQPAPQVIEMAVEVDEEPPQKKKGKRD